MTNYEAIYGTILKSYYKRTSAFSYEGLGILNNELVSDLQKTYKYFYKNDEKALLVPFEQRALHDVAVGKVSDNYYELCYRWNIEAGNRYAEFVTGKYEIVDRIPDGTCFDRLGEPTGTYVCELPSSGIPYTVSQRALPYYFFEPDIQNEWAYHRYISTCNISIPILLDNLSDFSDSDQFVLRTQLSEKRIVKGTIASVESFAEQGTGGGIQYLLPINIRSLLKMGVIREVEKCF